jgi:hypothetical protein
VSVIIKNVFVITGILILLEKKYGLDHIGQRIANITSLKPKVGQARLAAQSMFVMDVLK